MDGHPAGSPPRIVAHGSKPPNEPRGLNGNISPSWATTAPYFYNVKFKIVGIHEFILAIITCRLLV